MLLALLLAPGAWALTAEQALKMATGDGEDRVQAINEAVLDADDRTRAFIDALSNDAVKASDKAASASSLSLATNMLSTTLYMDWMNMDRIDGAASLKRSGSMGSVPSLLSCGLFVNAIPPSRDYSMRIHR